MNILIIDDDTAIRDSFNEMLKIFGHNISQAACADDAIKILDTQSFDFIFIDYNLPDKSGLELLRYIKEKRPSAKTAMLTGCPLMKEDLAKFAGVDYYLQKPFDAAKIVRIINGMT